MIEVKNLSKSFGNLSVLNNISERIEDKEVVCIIGPSGSGKSTFLRCLNLLEKPDSGDIVLDGETITDSKINIDKVREKLGMVFQNFNLFPHKNTLENIALAPVKVKGMHKSDAENKAMELLKTVGLEDKAGVYPSALSGGQKQRVAIARALAMEPEIMLFDKPTSALDLRLSQGKSITVFFYHGPTSQAVAFERLLENGENFWNKLAAAFSGGLRNIATDGESYGHHFPFGEMALAYVVDQARQGRDNLTLTNYAAYLAAHPADHEAVLHENTSWSHRRQH